MRGSGPYGFGSCLCGHFAHGLELETKPLEPFISSCFVVIWQLEVIMNMPLYRAFFVSLVPKWTITWASTAHHGLVEILQDPADWNICAEQNLKAMRK